MIGSDFEDLVSGLRRIGVAFGRARDDIEALCLRAENGDYRGVLQNTRLISEVLLRSIVENELHQSPGNMTLDKLINVVHQHDLVPDSVLAHLRAIQAFGNLGVHDHAGDLFATVDSVTSDHAGSALLSMSAIAHWYHGKHLHGPQSPAPNTDRRSRLRTGVVVAAITVLVCGAWLLRGIVAGPSRHASSTVTAPRSAKAEEERRALDKLLTLRGDPLAPLACRSTSPDDVTRLLHFAREVLGAQQKQASSQVHDSDPLRTERSAERWYLVALSRRQSGAKAGDVAAAADRAVSLCPGYAAAYKVAGTARLLGGDPVGAAQLFERAIRADDSYLAARFNHGLSLLAANQAEDAITALSSLIERDKRYPDAHLVRGRAFMAVKKWARAAADLETAVAQNPNDAGAWIVLGQARQQAGSNEAAHDAFCRAAELGDKTAAALCAR